MNFSLTSLFLLNISFIVYAESAELSPSQIVNDQLSALLKSLTQLKVAQFNSLFDDQKVELDTVFQPNFLYPNNVFASMGDKEFASSLKIFTPFEPTLTKNGNIRALVTIRYKMGGQLFKMDKEVVIGKDPKSSTGYVFVAFKSV